ncbi:ROK family protein [Pedobacter lithocola]|uniref:ROK family protein n=1 Tax=Pedobacter lithocola TaxID=1908239 RepID=A0ABV8PFG9_9SPHI
MSQISNLTSPISISKMLAIGIDIGGTRTKIGLVDIENGSVIDVLISPTETKDGHWFLANIAMAINTFKTYAERNNKQLIGIGFGIPGFVFENGVVDSTYGFLEFMEDYPLKAIIERQHQLPCKLDNDARVVTLGEALYGEGNGFNRVLVLTLGTGLGLGFTINGKLNEALAYAHMGGNITITSNQIKCYCGKTGCLESLASATGLCNAAERINWRTKYPDIPITAENIFKERNNGNTEAELLVADFIAYLKIGIDTYINLFAPDKIVLGGGVAKGLANDLEKFYSNELLRPYKNYKVSIGVSKLEEQAGILGSAALFFIS